MRQRLVFYGALVLVLLGVGLHFALESPQVRVEIALWKMRHPHARVASEGFSELQNLYYTKWAAVDPVLAHTEDPHRISFLVERNVELPGIRPLQGFGVQGRPWYYKTDRVYCRTLGEAIRAFLYNERDVRGAPRWRRDYEGDWDAWWIANRGFYGV
jgi:hypothetical protein